MYGLLISFGILVSSLFAEREVRKANLPTDVLWEGLFIVLVTGFFGARIYHVIEYWSYYKLHLFYVFAIWHGGMSIIGALLFAIPAIYFYLRKNNQPINVWLDLVAFVLPIGQIIGRWGNYFNKELLPYAYYEMVFLFLLFFVLVFVKKKVTSPGFIFKTYILGYAVIRFVLEDTRPTHWVINGFDVLKGISLSAIIVILLSYVIYRFRPWRFQTKK